MSHLYWAVLNLLGWRNVSPGEWDGYDDPPPTRNYQRARALQRKDTPCDS